MTTQQGKFHASSIGHEQRVHWQCKHQICCNFGKRMASRHVRPSLVQECVPANSQDSSPTHNTAFEQRGIADKVLCGGSSREGLRERAYHSTNQGAYTPVAQLVIVAVRTQLPTPCVRSTASGRCATCGSVASASIGLASLLQHCEDLQSAVCSCRRLEMCWASRSPTNMTRPAVAAFVM